uniref:Calcineurin n=1 Tax=Solanum tuberosum TaxID=4113 RepID=M1B4B8_SOLTU
MGNASSMLTQYDIEDVQDHCDHLFAQQEIVSLYQRFCQLDRNSKGFISADEFLSVPEFAMNPLSQRLLKMVDGLNFKDFVAFLSTFSAKASVAQKIELLTDFVTYHVVLVIFKVYDSDCNGKVTFDDIMEVLRDLTGSFISDKQREIMDHPGLKMEVEVPID